MLSGLLSGGCAVCARPGASPCLSCVGLLQHPGNIACPAGLDSCVAAISFEGAGRALVSSLKYRNNRQSLAWFSAAIAQQVTSEVDLVTWIPTTARRRRKRGFDHAELLGRRVGRRLAIPAKPLLRAPVARSARSQTGLTARERERRDAFVAVRCRAGSVLVVDDVITTGATLKSAAAALRCVGVDRVHGAAIAYTKPRGSELRHA